MVWGEIHKEIFLVKPERERERERESEIVRLRHRWEVILQRVLKKDVFDTEGNIMI